MTPELKKKLIKLETLAGKISDLNFQAIAIVTDIRENKLITDETDPLARQIIFKSGFLEYLD